MKKIFIISSALLIVALFLLGTYNLIFKDDTAKNIVQDSPIPEKVAEKKPERIKVVSDQSVISPFFDEKNETITYYAAKDGTVWQISADGEDKKQIDATKLEGIKNVSWSPDHKKVITTFEKGEQDSFYVYNHENKKGTSLKSGVDTVIWDNMSAKIFYKYYDEKKKERSLNYSNIDGSDWKKITDIDFRNLVMAAIPSTSTISFWNYPDAAQESRLQIVGAVSGQPQTIFQGKYGADYLWSPDGTQALISSLKNNNEKTMTLGVLKSANSEYHDLGIPTMVSKCVWSSDSKTVYYALPGDIPDWAILPNDYIDKKFTTQDTFWKMDVTTGKKERVIETTDISGKYDSTNLFLSNKEENLYFVNRIDGKLYRIEM